MGEKMMMNDAGLLKVSLGLSTIGIILLFYVSTTTEPSRVSIGEVDFDDSGRLISIEGRITSKRVNKDGHMFIKLADDTGSISTVLFSSAAKQLDTVVLECLREGADVTVTGRVEEYRGALEVIPREGDGVRCSTS